ncbi:MAG TPA: hypothetical protein VFG50_17130 [Rhodothermales bacterium]|nr:hypothetical protein [Rhodothermales bacterium]
MTRFYTALVLFLALPIAGSVCLAQADLADPAGGALRASDGQPVAIWITHVKADRRAEFESLLDKFWKAGDAAYRSGKMEEKMRAAYRGVRVLYPQAPEEDGTYTYVYLVDPYLPGANYEMLDFWRLSYPEDEARKLDQQMGETMAAPQGEIYVVQKGY